MAYSPRTLVFYPTSPSHISNLNLIADKLVGWNILCVISGFATKNSPGIISAVEKYQYSFVVFDIPEMLDKQLPDEVSIVMLGAVFERFGMDVFIWAKLRNIPVVAVEEVAQLSLNNLEINNYDLPFDALFVANKVEFELFQKLGHDENKLFVSGLLSTERARGSFDKQAISDKYDVVGNERILLYTTSPLRNRYAIHNRDSWEFRASVLKTLAEELSCGWQIIIKLHPNEDLKSERKRIKKILPNALVLGREAEVNELIAIADVILNRGNSQTVLDAVLTGCPAVILACGIKTLFHEYGGAIVVEDLSEIRGALAKAAYGEGGCLAYFIENHRCSPPGGTSTFIAKNLVEIAESSAPHGRDQWEWTVKTLLFLGMMKRLPFLFERLENKSPLLCSVDSAVRKQLEGQRSAAAVHWEECSRLAPDWFYPHCQLAHIYRSIKSWPNCLKQIELSLKKQPSFHFLWHSVPLKALQASCFRAMGRHREALASLLPLESSGILQCMPVLLVEKGKILFEMGQKVDALEYFETAYGVLNRPAPCRPKVDAKLYEQMGVVCFNMGFYQKALLFKKKYFCLINDKIGYLEYRSKVYSRQKKYLSLILNKMVISYYKIMGEEN